MKRKRKIKLKYRNIIILFVIMIGIIIGIKLLSSHDKPVALADLLPQYVGKNESALEDLQKYNVSFDKDYEFNDTYDEGQIISLNENNKEIKVVISKGQIKDDTYREYKVNELGNVPIMMYHGIVDTDENKYTGGNVDKDGYNRTSNAFRKDLEFFYENNYRMIRLNDYVNGIIDVEMGKSPIVLTFDDGNKNNFHVLGRKSDGSLDIDPECAIGILEDFKRKHPDMHVTATFFVMNNLFNQKEYDEEIIKWLVDNGYDVGNHTTIHADFTTISTSKTKEVVGKMYQKLEQIIPGQYVKIVALPFGSPYKKTHANYPYILSGTYNDISYETEAALRVGWEAEVSPFNTNFDKTFLKRCRAYDNNGKEFDIEMVFKNLEKNRYISDGDKDKIVIRKKDESKLNKEIENVYMYEEN